MLDNLLSFSISLLIGLLIGIERERSHLKGVKMIGVRTFTLFALLGTLAAVLNQPALTITLSVFIFGILLLSYIHTTVRFRKNDDIGIVTELVASATYCLGYMVHAKPLVAITVSAVVFLVLVERKRLHALALKKFKAHEIETAIILVIFTLGIIPVLPNHAVDIYGLFNPRNFAILIATIAAIQFCGYVAIQLFGERFGIALFGFLGGFVSSTAVFASLSDMLKKYPGFVLAMLIEVMVIIFVASPSLLIHLVWPLITMIIAGLVFVMGLLLFQKKKRHVKPVISNPLNMLSIIRTSFILAISFVLVSLTKQILGTEGTLFVFFLGGLFEIHGVTLATALLYLQNELSVYVACSMLYLAILASYLSKIILLFTLIPFRIAVQTALILLGMSASGGLIYWLISYNF